MEKRINYKILVADKDQETIKSIKKIFSEEEAKIFTARTADIAMQMIHGSEPDVVILGQDLLDLTGWEVLGLLKKNERTRLIPSIMLGNSHGGTEDELKAFELKADDYIHRPFNPEVFLARIRALFHRCLNCDRKTLLREKTIKSGKISINTTNRKVFVNKKEVDLNPKEFALLELFVNNRRKVLNRPFLSKKIWDREHFYTTHTINKHIANLRKKLESEGKRIETMHTIGYRFN